MISELRAFEVLRDFINAPVLRRVSERFLTAALRYGRFLPGERLAEAVHAYMRADTPCAGSNTKRPHYRFNHWFLDHFGERIFKRGRRYLVETPPELAAIRLDRLLRMCFFAEVGALLLQREKERRGDEGFAPLNQAQIALYPYCDLHCEGCYTEEERTGRPPRREDIGWLFDEVGRCGAHYVHLIGKGEPFLSPSFASDLLDAIADHPDLFFTIATHGGRLTPELCARLARLGNVIILVSIDGPPAIHDARRGPGSYARARAGMALLREHRVLFGYSTTVTAQSHTAVSSPDYVAELVAAGCAVGMYSRYFPLSPQSSEKLKLSPAAMGSYLRAFAKIRDSAEIPLLDLDDIEEYTGCHSRSGDSVYIDGISGQVSPCLRVPFAPAECRLDAQAGIGLFDVLSHPYFIEYRRRTGPCPSFCGADLHGELAAVEKLLSAYEKGDDRLAAYRQRSPGAETLSRRHLPVVT